ncbi:MAG: YebC/PmpR family DNA-binding transcriptional regulator [Gammaproteobacteria bacterium TMED180]|jgi:YebC/PmpR family DNA-binding regulatory protein|nr:MAG: YebC/PmpR family DNA-binding transcriptional regulator [Gammaproteobacteria bacterium TMED180]|tara:strand:+ start:74 stop:811 length:738 start_codon:yes stop_codon:yes gene_type:complete
MAGHSKWSNIKHRKAGQDAKRAKVFTKIIRELTVAARDGGANPEDNPSLRGVIEKAKSAQMPKDTMERAIIRGAGGDDGAQLIALTYEGYGPGGVAVLVETMTDNRNRTVAEVRHAFSKAGGSLGTDGSVSYLFEKKGILCLNSVKREDDIIEIAIENGAEDVETLDDQSIEITTSVDNYVLVKKALAEADFEVFSGEITLVASSSNSLDDSMSSKVLGLLDSLEDLDDVTAVHCNGEFPDGFSG